MPWLAGGPVSAVLAELQQFPASKPALQKASRCRPGLLLVFHMVDGRSLAFQQMSGSVRGVTGSAHATAIPTHKLVHAEKNRVFGHFVENGAGVGACSGAASRLGLASLVSRAPSSDLFTGVVR